MRTLQKSFMCLMMLVMLLLGGCAADEAPAQINNVSQWLWRNIDTATDAELANAIVQLNGTVTAVTADEPLKVLIDRLTDQDIAVTGRTGLKAADAVGMLVVTEIKCKISQIDKIFSAPDQQAIHPGFYSAYKRTYEGSRDDYLAGKVNRLNWLTELTSDFASEKLQVGARRVPDLGKVQSPYGVALLGRTWLKENAIPVASGTEWQQDYQVDAYYERTPGRVVHLFALWRQATFYNLSNEKTLIQNNQMDGFVDGDKEVEAACASGQF